MESGTIEQSLPGLEPTGPPEVAVTTGHAIPLTPQKRLMVFAGRSHRELASKIAEQLGVELGEVELDDVRERRDLLPLRGVDTRRRRVHRADRLRPVDQNSWSSSS